MNPLFTKDNVKRVGVPNVVEIEAVLQGIRQALETNQLTNNGPRIQEFEKKIAEYLDVKEFVTVNNATNGLMAVAKCLDLGINPLKRKIIVPSFTFCATVNAMVWMNLEPVFCDIDAKTYQLDPQKVREALTPEVCAILGVHVYGAIGDIPVLEQIANEANIPLFFDAAHAFGCSFQGKKIGHYGKCEIFSFHATKAFNTFEGGGIASNDTALATRLRKLNNFGFVGYDNIGDIGINSKMSEINAIQGLVMLKHFPHIIAHNKSNYEVYKKVFSKFPEKIRLLEHNNDSNFHYVVIEVDNSQLRDELVNKCAEQNVILRKYFYPGVHRMQPYASSKTWILPNTDQLSERVLCLPSGLHVQGNDSEKIATLILSLIYCDKI